MRRLACLAVFVLFAAAPAQAQEWQTYRSAAGGYSVEMPGVPQQRQMQREAEIGPITIHAAQLALPGREFIATHIDFPAGHFARLGLDQAFANARDGAARNRQILGERRLQLGGHPALEVVASRGNVVYVARSVIVGDRVVQVVYGGPLGSETSPDARRFIDSFALAGR